MTATDRLREMVAQATPSKWASRKSRMFPTVTGPDSEYRPIAEIASYATRESEAQANADLIALAPDLAALLADMAEAAQEAVSEFKPFAHEEGSPLVWRMGELADLLARFDALLPEQPKDADEETGLAYNEWYAARLAAPSRNTQAADPGEAVQ